MRDAYYNACTTTPLADARARRLAWFALAGLVACMLGFALGPILIFATSNASTPSMFYAMGCMALTNLSLVAGVFCGLAHQSMQVCNAKKFDEVIATAPDGSCLHSAVDSWKREGYTLRYRDLWRVRDAMAYRQRHHFLPLHPAALDAAVAIPGVHP